MAADQIDRLPNSELYRSPACLAGEPCRIDRLPNRRGRRDAIPQVGEPCRIDRFPNPCRRKAAASTVFSEPMSTKRTASSLCDPRKKQRFLGSPEA